MQQEHLRVWFAPEDIQGKKIHEQLEEAIRVYEKLLVVLSDQSVQSEWVATELYNARQTELQQGRRKLFPIRLVNMDTLKRWKCFDADTGKDLAREVREYHIPDFSHWKDHDAFEVAFARLLRDLKATEAPPPTSSGTCTADNHGVAGISTDPPSELGCNQDPANAASGTAAGTHRGEYNARGADGNRRLATRACRVKAAVCGE
jgi:hypothetical protein